MMDKIAKTLIAIAITCGIIWALFHRATVHEWMQQPIMELQVRELIMIGYFTAWVGSSITKVTRK